MNQQKAIQWLQHPEVWPFRVVLPLVHCSRLDPRGYPLCGFVAIGHRSRLYLGHIGELEHGEMSSREALDHALKRFEVMCYLSFEAIIYDGWRVD